MTITHYNLIPWRDNLRKKRRILQQYIMASMLIIGCSMLIFMHLHIQQLITEQLQEHNKLNKKKQLLNQQQQKLTQLSALHSILLHTTHQYQHINQSHVLIYKALHAVTTAVPHAINFSSITQHAQHISLLGHTDSLPIFNQWLIGLKKDPLIKTVILNEINKNHDVNLQLTLHITQPI